MPKRVKMAADLTKEMLADSGAWRDRAVRPHNFAARGADVGGGYLHPLLKVRSEFRKIFAGDGFEEMPMNQWVESSFWNFDTLFQPQSHPGATPTTRSSRAAARCTLRVPEDYYEREDDTRGWWYVEIWRRPRIAMRR